MSTALPPRGRGTATNLHNRFAPTVSVAEDDGWYQEVPPTQGTEVRIETAKTIITRGGAHIAFAQIGHVACAHGCALIAPAAADETDHIRHFLVRQTPGKRRHGEG